MAQPGNEPTASPASTRREVLAASAAVGAATLLPERLATAADGDTTQPFQINIAEEQLVDLRRRINATKWPEQETVTDELAMEEVESWDSLQHMNLIASLEQSFGIELTFEEIIAMQNVGEIRRILELKGVEL